MVQMFDPVSSQLLARRLTWKIRFSIVLSVLEILAKSKKTKNLYAEVKKPWHKTLIGMMREVA